MNIFNTAILISIVIFLTGCVVIANPSMITHDEMIGDHTPSYLIEDGYEHCYDVDFEGKDYIYMMKR